MSGDDLAALIDTESLEQLQRLAARHHADCVLVGAAVWHAWNLAGPVTTQDIDFVIGLDLDDWPAFSTTLIEAGWHPHPRLEHEWRTPKGAIVDLLPAGPQARRHGSFTWPRSGLTMNLAGFDHAFARARARPVSAGHAVWCIDLAVYALLKMVAFLDRPERGKDIEDLAALFERYDQDTDRFYVDPPLNMPHEHRGAFLLGRDLREFCTKGERELIARFVAQIDPESGIWAWRVRKVLRDFHGEECLRFGMQCAILLDALSAPPAL